ncbi:MAG TPA: hypothetical protein VK791_07940 [bacterium]|jgi:hypothetical protein|nr:hypothetical protein [bacterium]
MKKYLMAVCLAALTVLSGFSYAETKTEPTPISIPPVKHDIEKEIEQHVENQKSRIKKALAAKIITADAAKTLQKPVISIHGRLEFFYHQNQNRYLKKDQEAQIYQLLTNSAQAIDKATGTSKDPS